MKKRFGSMCLMALACTPVASGPNDVIAIEVQSPTSVQLTVGDTITLQAVALTTDGTEAQDVQIIWAILDVDSGQVGFTLDTLSGLVRANAAGGARVQARVETLRADPLTISVINPPVPYSSQEP